MQNYLDDVFDKFNVAYGCVIGALAMIFGKFWFLFVGFLILNIIDRITGKEKARRLNNFTTKRNKDGVVNKLLLWIVVLVSFMAAWIFTVLGQALHMDLGFSIIMSYLILGALIVNEFNSIIENLVECGIDVPKVLTRGLKVANNILNEDEKGESEAK